MAAMMDFEWLRTVGENPRIHGNGFIQIDLKDSKSRVHVFGHPEVPRQRTPTPVHDHRWGFMSTILSGCLVNVNWTFHTDDRDEHTHFVCGYEPSQVGGEDTALIPSDVTGYLRQLRPASAMTAGYGYTIEQGALHETFANEPTITLMSKKPIIPDYATSPRVLCRIGLEPDNHFTRYDCTEDDIWRMVEDAFRWCR